jgi:hypothetical protein
MRAPLTLPERTYLLAYDRDRDRMGRCRWLAYAVRAAALADLTATGHIVDDRGHATAVDGVRPPVDPILRDVLAEVAATGRGGRKWSTLVTRHRRETENAVAARLDADGYIRLESPATWWRGARVELRDPRAVTRNADAFAATVRGATPIERTPPADVALIAILAVASIRTGLTKEQRREYADRVKAAIAAAGAAADGLKRAIRDANTVS